MLSTLIIIVINLENNLQKFTLYPSLNNAFPTLGSSSVSEHFSFYADTQYSNRVTSIARFKYFSLSRDQEDRRAVGFVLGNKLQQHSKISDYVCNSKLLTCF